MSYANVNHHSDGDNYPIGNSELSAAFTFMFQLSMVADFQ